MSEGADPVAAHEGKLRAAATRLDEITELLNAGGIEDSEAVALAQEAAEIAAEVGAIAAEAARAASERGESA